MLLSEFFDYLSYGPLAQHAVGIDDTGNIANKDYPKVVSALNLALTRLHTQLPLKAGQLLVQTNTNQNLYTLSSKFAASKAPAEPDGVNRYILDDSDPFGDDIITIDQVIDEKGESYSLNNENVEKSVFTPAFNRIQFSEPLDQVVTVTYRANHAKLPLSKRLDPDSLEIEVPDFCMDALVFYCAYKLISTFDPTQSQVAAAYYSQFMNAVAEIEALGLLHSVLPKKSERFVRERWV
ncbi:hypothetical protein [Marisediminitalea sp.]|uniref:phage adaptor protein n=1 Tax=Marisediminitalea sp. TaxID=2662268 RepID=UPI003512242E